MVEAIKVKSPEEIQQMIKNLKVKALKVLEKAEKLEQDHNHFLREWKKDLEKK